MHQIPKNHKLIAVPLFEVHDNSARYGAVISAIPTLLARYAIMLSLREEGLLPPPGSVGPILNGPAALSGPPIGGPRPPAASQGQWHGDVRTQGVAEPAAAQAPMQTEGGDDEQGGGLAFDFEDEEE